MRSFQSHPYLRYPESPPISRLQTGSQLLCDRFITHLLACPEFALSLSRHPGMPGVRPPPILQSRAGIRLCARFITHLFATWSPPPYLTSRLTSGHPAMRSFHYPSPCVPRSRPLPFDEVSGYVLVFHHPSRQRSRRYPESPHFTVATHERASGHAIVSLPISSCAQSSQLALSH